jgi:histidinol-phosphate/aromatic aminotransferase/cobyric acid decarboxylase-like protein
LSRLGLQAFPSAANFVLVKCPVPADELAEALRERGVAVRSFPALARLGDCVRVTVGPWPFMERFLEALRDSLRDRGITGRGGRAEAAGSAPAAGRDLGEPDEVVP